MAAALRLRGISKRFGALQANDAISLSLARGQVLALLGENGAGKSTLVSILFGHYVADVGEIEVFGRPLPPGQPKAALAAGIGMVHQHFTLAERLSVLDNVMLGLEPLWRPFSRRRALRQRLLETAQRFGLQVDPEALIADLSVGERQRVEILKALVRGARILILDEPTAVLTPQESEALFGSLKALVAEGLSIIFISHKLDEVLAVSDRIAVLRAGKLVAELPNEAGLSKADLAEAMVGRAVQPPRRSSAAAAPGEPVCTLRGARLVGKPGLRGVDLELRAGEVLAVAGVAGNGQQALAELLQGLHGLDGGELRVLGQDLAPRPRAWLAAGVARIPEDRHAVGVVGDLALWENALLEQYRSRGFARFCSQLIRRGRARAHAQDIVRRFDVRGLEDRGLDTVTRSLSGGNMQKLILGRALSGDPAAGRPPKLIVANQPTWGLDIGAVAYVHQQLLDACAAGAAVLLISEDLDEIFTIADRIAVMHDGHLSAARPRADWTLAGIGLAMAGNEERQTHAA
ncbi:ABC transporter ATP-binding protein [Roseateles sp. DAIF2]|uniref:ABC transporter ATP-binding protein n=1 Tax=Roseateles sp. DAIF2 TaxID=2714952 RepID=UPI0018A338E4|nr:ABC transporter ATP-binding protein [Roseateles sp. DAIF2]QPF75976.1 ABC transporter ATP-binding protein [Roseateles sp. DAIF2]